MKLNDEYFTLVASDVGRDGLGVELYDSERQMLVEVFRDDTAGTTTVNLLVEAEIPFEVFEAYMAQARSRLLEF